MKLSLELQYFSCPDCHGSLRETDDALHCDHCKVRYGVSGGRLDLVAPKLRGPMETRGSPGWERWHEAVAGLGRWRARRETLRNLTGVLPEDGTNDSEKRAFLGTMGLQGRVLDVGAGDGSLAALLPNGCQYVGLEPLEPPSRRGDALVVKGLAEAMPFADRSMQAVVSFASMDYFVDTDRALQECSRVLVPGGTFGLLVSTVSATVALARGARGRSSRVESSVRAMREVGLLAGMRLVGAAALEPERAHVRYLTRSQVLAYVSVYFEVLSQREVPQATSSVLYLHARKRKNTRLKVIS